VSIPLFGSVGIALIVIVNVAALAAGVLLYRLTVFEWGDRRLADRAVWLLALFPPAAVLVLGYAEALLLVLSIACFLALRRKQWWSAAAVGFLAGLCRPLGVALAVPALIEGLRGLRGARAGRRPPRPADLAGRIAAVVAPLLGCGVYLAWVQREFGDWFLPIDQQNTTELREGWANPLSTVWHAVDSVNDQQLGEALHLPWIVAFGALLLLAARRLPASYSIYSGILLVIALSGHTLGSFERYGLSAFPLVIAFAMEVTRTRTELIAVAVCAIGLTGFTTLEMLGTFVP
jgi:hypothetical protein